MSPSRNPYANGELHILVKLNTDGSDHQTTWQVMNNRISQITEGGSGYKEKT